MAPARPCFLDHDEQEQAGISERLDDVLQPLCDGFEHAALYTKPLTRIIHIIAGCDLSVHVNDPGQMPRPLRLRHTSAPPNSVAITDDPSSSMNTTDRSPVLGS